MILISDLPGDEDAQEQAMDPQRGCRCRRYGCHNRLTRARCSRRRCVNTSVAILMCRNIYLFTSNANIGAGVPCMVAYVYGVVPIALLRNGGACGIERSDLGEHIDIDDVREEPATSPIESANATGSLPLRTKAISSEVRPTSSQKRAALSIGSDAGAADSHTSTRVDRLGAKKKTSKSVFRQRRSSAGSESLSASIGGRSDNASTRALAGSIAGRK